MRKYKAKITETLEKVVFVEARNKTEAEQIVCVAWNDSAYILDADNFVGVNFTAEPAVKNWDHDAR